MSTKTAAQITQKYQNGVQGAGQAYSDGVASPSTSWATATVAGAARYKASVMEAIQKGKFERGVQKAGDQKWQQNASSKGARNYTAAAADAANAYQQKAEHIMRAGSSARQAARALGNATKEQRIQRAVAAMNATSNYWAGVNGG